MSDETIPVGVVGVGHLGRHHARLYGTLPGARLVGVVDTDPERARTIAQASGCEVVTTVEDLARRVRAASVAVPTVAHLRVARTLLEAGVHVLVEKPLAPSVGEADELLEAAERAGCLVMVGHTERFNPAVATLSRLVDSPRFLEIHRLSGFSARSTDVDVVLDLMIHDLDLLLFLDGSEPVTVDAIGVSALTDKLDIANARIRMSSGCVANLTASRISTENVRRVRVFQARTYLGCDTSTRRVDRYRVVTAASGAPAIEHEQIPVPPGEPLAIELASFLDAVRAGTPPPVSGRDGRRAVALAERVLEAIARTGALAEGGS